MVRREQTRARVQVDVREDVYTDYIYIYIYDIFSTFGKDVAYRKGRRRLIVINKRD